MVLTWISICSLLWSCHWGKVAEFDTVLNLFDKTDSIFRSLLSWAAAWGRLWTVQYHTWPSFFLGLRSHGQTAPASVSTCFSPPPLFFATTTFLAPLPVLSFVSFILSNGSFHFTNRVFLDIHQSFCLSLGFWHTKPRIFELPSSCRRNDRLRTIPQARLLEGSLHAPQLSRSSSIDMNLSSDNHMSAGRYVAKWCCRTLTDLFSSNSPLIMVPMVGVDHTPTNVIFGPRFSIDTYCSRVIWFYWCPRSLGPQTSLTVSDHIALMTVSR